MILVYQTVLKLIEKIAKVSIFWKKLQKFQVCGKIADISRFWLVFVASDLIEKYKYLLI